MIKRTSITIALIVAIVLGVYAQDNSQQSKGEIVMTKSELASFLARIATTKKKKMQEDRKKADQEKLAQLRLGYYGFQPNAAHYASGDNNAYLMGEITRLNARLDYMMGNKPYSQGNSSTMVTPHGAMGGVCPYKNASTKTIVVDQRHSIDSLQSQLNELNAGRALSEEEVAVLKRYGSTKLQVFFANNVSDVAPEYKEEVKRAAEILKDNPQLTIVLKGYASTVGNPKYNYDLSMRRNESVKRMLIDFGVFPDQISSIFYGEDTSTSESVARRVDMSFIIK